MNKDLNRHNHNKYVSHIFAFIVLATVALALFSLITPQYNFALAAILAKIGHFNHVNMTTKPTKE